MASFACFVKSFPNILDISATVDQLEQLKEHFLIELSQNRGNGKGRKRQIKRLIDSSTMSEMSTKLEDTVEKPSLKPGKYENVLVDLPVNEEVGERQKGLRKRKRKKDYAADNESTISSVTEYGIEYNSLARDELVGSVMANARNESKSSFRPTNEFSGFDSAGESFMGRPKRAASRLASTYIHSHVRTNLRRKVRRPDESCVDEFGFVKPTAPVVANKEDNPRQSSRDTGTRPKPSRSKASNVSHVKDRIALFEELARETPSKIKTTTDLSHNVMVDGVSVSPIPPISGVQRVFRESKDMFSSTMNNSRGTRSTFTMGDNNTTITNVPAIENETGNLTETTTPVIKTQSNNVKESVVGDDSIVLSVTANPNESKTRKRKRGIKNGEQNQLIAGFIEETVDNFNSTVIIKENEHSEQEKILIANETLVASKDPKSMEGSSMLSNKQCNFVKDDNAKLEDLIVTKANKGRNNNRCVEENAISTAASITVASALNSKQCSFLIEEDVKLKDFNETKAKKGRNNNCLVEENDMSTAASITVASALNNKQCSLLIEEDVKLKDLNETKAKKGRNNKRRIDESAMSCTSLIVAPILDDANSSKGSNDNCVVKDSNFDNVNLSKNKKRKIDLNSQDNSCPNNISTSIEAVTDTKADILNTDTAMNGLEIVNCNLKNLDDKSILSGSPVETNFNSTQILSKNNSTFSKKSNVVSEQSPAFSASTSTPIEVNRRSSRKQGKAGNNCELKEVEIKCSSDGSLDASIVITSVEESSSSSPSEPPTVFKTKRTRQRKSKQSATADADIFANATFVIPVLPAKKANPKCYDGDGNVMPECPRSTRTRTLQCASVPDLVNIDGGRPKRVRTKVRRFGDEDSDTEGASDAADSKRKSGRVTRSKMRKPRAGDENIPVKVLSAKPRRSSTQSKRISLKVKKTIGSAVRLSSRFKTPFSPLTSKMNVKKIVVSSKKAILSAKKTVDDETDAKNAQIRQNKEHLAQQKRKVEQDKKTKMLKMKNDEKLERVMKARQMELEKQEQIASAERLKELRRQQAIEERKQKQQAEIARKKLAEARKMAEVEERRRIEEEARLAKVREMELEQQKLAQLKIKEQELEEKRARERQEEAKKLKEAEKALALKLVKRAEGIKARPGLPGTPISAKYKPRNDDDFGLEDEHSENSDDEEHPTPTRAPPRWVAAAKSAKTIMIHLTLEQLTTFVPPAPKTPNIQKMFNMTPSRQLRRNSSAIWNTPDFK